MKHLLAISLFTAINLSLNAQTIEKAKDERFSIHAQTTVINQWKPSFEAKYTGENSLITEKESQTSITSTLYAGAKLWKGASIFINPEIAGGAGLSKVLGIADATNGETFRVGDPSPKIYLARFFYRQLFDLNKGTEFNERDYVHIDTDFNALSEFIPSKYIAITVGKVSMADHFDDNVYSHDPRTQFLSWGLMSNGAWDYPANTRGYTYSAVLEFVSPVHEFRYGFSLLPLTANGNDLNWNISKAGAHTFEYCRHYNVNKRKGAVRLLGFLNSANMGNYRESIDLSSESPDITATRKYGRTKYGFGLNIEQSINGDLGGFFRASWNDGRNETWAFTEIDHSLSIGFSLKGQRWKRKHDNLGLAYVTSGISDDHIEYLRLGGKGFMLGDGNLNYSWEHLAELYYSAELVKDSIYLTGAYQFVANPGYNFDRHGPVYVFSVRLHARI